MKEPLFITRFSLSGETAIGAQTRLLAAEFEAWQHVFFAAQPVVQFPHVESVGLQSRIVRSRVANIRTVAKVMAALGVPFWDGTAVRRNHVARFRARYQNRVGAVYFAPLDAEDAARMRDLVSILGKPFVLHIWDFLHSEPDGSEDWIWLIHHAKVVFCLSTPIMNRVASLGATPKRLLFTRRESRFSAVFPESRSLRVLLMGNMEPYRDGLQMLAAALPATRDLGIRFEIVYVGPARQSPYLHELFGEELRCLGFIQDDTEMDQAISSCHVAFLPGPSADPAKDLRSKYSVPSRILDFFASGLPVIAAVHPAGATAEMLGEFLPEFGGFCLSAQDIADRLAQLIEPSHWTAQSQSCRKAFTAITNLNPAKLLKETMIHICELSSS